jgi:hypothetical protein
MKISRRGFIESASAAALAVGLILPTRNAFGQTQNTMQSFPLPPESTENALNYLRRDHFAAFVNSIFVFQSENGATYKLKLIEAADLSRKRNNEQGFIGESFSLLFEGSRKFPLAQGSYLTDHDRLGKFELFIVPVGLRVNRYEAVINRINMPN